MNKRRLLKLADLLEDDAKNKKGVKFDLTTWGRAFDDDGPMSISCGTTACAMGLAVLSGAFKRAGLTNFYGDGTSIILPSMESGANGLDAAVELFDITSHAAGFLFYDDYYPAKFQKGAHAERYVAKRIRDFVAGKVSPA